MSCNVNGTPQGDAVRHFPLPGLLVVQHFLGLHYVKTQCYDICMSHRNRGCKFGSEVLEVEVWHQFSTAPSHFHRGDLVLFSGSFY